MSPQLDLAWLAELCALPGVCGDEAAVRARVWQRLRPLAEEAFVDPLGTLCVTRRWRGGRGPRLVLAAHLDEVGLIVTGVEDCGLLRFEAVGGIDPRVLPGALLQVGPEGLPGAVALPPIHLTGREHQAEAPEISELRIEIGAANRTEAAVAVRPGDRAAFAGPCGPFGRFFRAKALDDRAGVAAVVAVFEACAGLELPLAAVFTVQEEIGTRGAAAVAAELRADRCIVVEATAAADLPDVPTRRRATRLGSGPALTALDGGLIASPRLRAELVAAAEAEGLRYQWKEAASGGTDGARFQAIGAETAVVSLPCRYLHAPAGVADPADLHGAARLIAAWARRCGEASRP